jgi:hypothetical protein
LGRGHDSADGVDGELLHCPVDRRPQDLQSRFFLGLDDVLGEPGGLGRRQLAEPGAAVFRRCLGPCLDDRGQCRLGLVRMALLDRELLLLFDQLGQILEIDDL